VGTRALAPLRSPGGRGRDTERIRASLNERGALNLYARLPGAFGVVDRPVRQSQPGAGTREVIGQAPGISMERERITLHQAFDIVRRASHDERDRARRVGKSVRFASPSTVWATRSVLHRPLTLEVDSAMIIIGIVLLAIGFIAAVPIIWTIGVIVLLIGLVFMVFGALGHAIGGRRHIF
jgi:hypothetical protein